MGWITCVVCISLTATLAQADEPAAQKDVPFWELPNATVDLQALRPAEIKLVSGPDLQRGLIVLQTGDGAPPPIDFVPGNEELKPFLPEKDSGYKVIPGGLKVGAVMYGDRNYRFERLPPAFVGLTLLQTKAGHKGIADSNYAITLSAAKPCLVFVAIDQRVMETYTQNGTPSWLLEYAPTGEQIKTDDPLMKVNENEYKVFVRKSAGGRIVLGPPAMDISTNSMYFAFFGEAKSP
jgi:hypothetical protein